MFISKLKSYISSKLKKDELNDLSIRSNKIVHSTVLFNNSSIGDYSYVSPSCIIDSCTIGKYCSIGPNTVIGFGEHPTDFMSTSPMFYYSDLVFDKTFAKQTHYEHHKNIVIKNDVWVGANVYIKNGVTIGNGAIIAAGAIIVKDVPDYAIYGGVPGKLIKYRFNDKMISKLLAIAWWDLEESVLDKFSEFLNVKLSEDMLDEFISLVKNKS